MTKRRGKAPDPGVCLEIAIGTDDARRLVRMAAAGGVTVETCAASIVAAVLADDAAAHGEALTTSVAPGGRA